MESTQDTYHRVKHKFRDVIIVPIIAISNNWDFLLNKRAKKRIKTADGAECIAVEWETNHICEFEEDIKKIYGLDPWTFIKRWYSSEPNFTSTEFVKIRLRREDKENNTIESNK